jgi:hypothetical protein
MWRYRVVLLLPGGVCASLLLFAHATPSYAQQQEFGAFFGGSLAQTRAFQGAAGDTVEVDAAYAAGIHFHHRILESRFLQPSIEAELTIVPPRIVRSAAAAVPRNYSALFLTPGVRVEVLPWARFHPWVAAGGGSDLFLQSQVLTNGQKYSVRVKGGATFDYGGGVDFRLLGARESGWGSKLFAQLRDYISGNPELNVPLQSGTQHTVIVTAGILLGK